LQVAGIALIVVGAIPLFKLADIKDAFPENNPATVPIIIVALGSIIFVISFFGCCGAIRENQCMVSTVMTHMCIHVHESY
jgi:CD63 antigen